MENKKYNIVNIAAVLSVSTLLYLAMINAATLPYLVQLYGDKYPITTIKLFSTIPSLMMIVCSLISGKLLSIFPIKKIVIGCAFIMMVAGFGTYFMTNLPAILILRVLYGCGSGTVFPLANAVIQQLFEGEQKSQLMGLRAGLGALFGAAVTMVGGWLTTMNWKYSFFGYLFAIPVILLVWFACPTNEPIKKAKTDSAEGEKKYTTKTFLVLIFVVFFNACMMSFNVELSLVVTGAGYTANDVSMISSTNTLFAFFAGLIFATLRKASKRYMAVIATGLVGLALLLGCFAGSVPFFMVCAAIFGLGFGFYNPCYNLLIASTAAQPKYGSNAIAIYTSCVGLGQFFSPYLVDFIKNTLGLTAARAEWNITATATLILVAIATGYIIMTGGNKNAKM